MSIDFKSLAVPGVRALSPYQPGKPIEEVARELGLAPSEIIKLASNENPLGPSAKALAAAKAALDDMCLYPDGNGFILKQKLAERLSVSTDQLTLGNGSNDVLELVIRAFAGPGDEVVFSQYAFAVYPISTQAVGATGISVPARNWGHDLDAMAAAITDRTRIVFVANPNNPTGTALGQAAIESFLNRVPEHVVVVLDEAYGEYFEGDEFPDGASMLPRHPNLVVARTFSKAWGLAALRVGYAVSSADIADVINRVRQAFNVDTVALSAATAVLDDDDYLQRSREVNRVGLRQLAEGFEKLGLAYIPSSGNFIAVDVGRDAESVFQGLLRHGVIVRPIGGYGMPNHLRISVGLADENARCLDALKQVLESADG
ncbi:histidinol-phosphate transaminase [Marinobacter sp. JSM 1782161]|uniref:histidinol-phosphate transaminase n=1 Tax=Marinobacter sp. JSM 1782161 TaxID=2685906 RepID=UPI0014033E75|nr:histidinol-phosphate transaminase [Marinobacter sp. JSM 1782161]